MRPEIFPFITRYLVTTVITCCMDFFAQMGSHPYQVIWQAHYFWLFPHIFTVKSDWHQLSVDGCVEFIVFLCFFWKEFTAFFSVIWSSWIKIVAEASSCNFPFIWQQPTGQSTHSKMICNDPPLWPSWISSCWNRSWFPPNKNEMMNPLDSYLNIYVYHGWMPSDVMYS